MSILDSLKKLPKTVFDYIGQASSCSSIKVPQGSAFPYKSNYTWIGPSLLALLFLSICMVYWRRWGDIIIDYGRELYIPWQISSGKVLYRDIDYFMGPIAPYLNALWFKLFGVSITILFIYNLIIIAMLTYILYKLIKNHSPSKSVVV